MIELTLLNIYGHTLVSYLYYLEGYDYKEKYYINLNNESVFSENNLNLLYTRSCCFDTNTYMELLFSYNIPIHYCRNRNSSNQVKYIIPNTITLGMIDNDFESHGFSVIAGFNMCAVFNTYGGYGSSEIVIHDISTFNRHVAMMRKSDDIYNRFKIMFGIEPIESSHATIIECIDFEIISRERLTNNLVLESMYKIRDKALATTSVDTSRDIEYLDRMIADSIKMID